MASNTATMKALAGGLIVPRADRVLPFSTDPGGSVHIQRTWSSGLPANTTLHVQFWIPDASSPTGWVAYNAASPVTPP